MTTKSILMALHNSKPDSAGQEMAISWAQESGARLMGLAIVDETVAKPTAVPIGGDAFKQEEQSELLAQRHRTAQSSAESFAEKCRAAEVLHDIRNRSGTPHEIIAEEMRSHDVAIIDKQPPADYGAGESPDEAIVNLLKMAPRPLICASGIYRPCNTILIAYDGSIPAARTLLALIGSGMASEKNVHLLTVDHDSEESARERAQSGIDYLEHHEISPILLPVVSNRPVAEIIHEVADRNGCDMIVMGTHARSALRKFLFGSVTKQTLQDSTVPVFLFH